MEVNRTQPSPFSKASLVYGLGPVAGWKWSILILERFVVIRSYFVVWAASDGQRWPLQLAEGVDLIKPFLLRSYSHFL